MVRVEELLAAKGHEVFSVPSDATVFAALVALAEHDVGAILVMERGEVVGIFSERDYARQVALQGRTSRETSVRDVMTTDVITVGPLDSVDHCMSLMTAKRIRHLPVVQRGAVLGVISIGDVVKSILRQQESTIRQLEGYISGVA